VAALQSYSFFADGLTEADCMVTNRSKDNFRYLQDYILLVCKQRLRPNQYHLQDILLQGMAAAAAAAAAASAAAAVAVVVLGKGM